MQMALSEVFSTLAVYAEVFQGEPIRVLYSGDTIIEQAYWGQNQMSKAWLELAGFIKQKRRIRHFIGCLL